MTTNLRIAFRVDGGLAAFPGLAQPVTIDCSALPPAQTAELEQLVRQANFFALPSRQPHAACARDARAYTIEIDDGHQCKSVTIGEPIADHALRQLVDALRAHAAVARRAR